ncbi:MAG TPA: sulfate ABC transporter permease subunit CysT [Verrucomicrobiae bacterium]|nr:sulfate ABC transporter permease subunit CysT [Verrucomicrobiae bacterium]
MGFKKHSVLPGFGLTLGFTLFYLSVVVLFPLSLLFFKTAALTWPQLVKALSSARTLAAFRLTFSVSLASALVNAVFGMLVAWVLVRYNFPAKKAVDALVDLPFALPTAVAGICLTAIYGPTGWVGKWLAPWGIKTAYSPLGIGIALVFIGLPFVVRTLEPVLQEMDIELEEAAHSLGASAWQTFSRVIFPTLFPALLTGTAMAFARALGEYGSVVFISGNMPGKTEILPLLIMTKLEQFDYPGATAIASVTLCISFLLLLFINMLQAWSRRYQKV